MDTMTTAGTTWDSDATRTGQPIAESRLLVVVGRTLQAGRWHQIVVCRCCGRPSTFRQENLQQALNRGKCTDCLNRGGANQHD